MKREKKDSNLSHFPSVNVYSLYISGSRSYSKRGQKPDISSSLLSPTLTYNIVLFILHRTSLWRMRVGEGKGMMMSAFSMFWIWTKAWYIKRASVYTWEMQIIAAFFSPSSLFLSHLYNFIHCNYWQRKWVILAIVRILLSWLNRFWDDIWPITS